MKKVRFLMIGGFLGAGKTTTIARLAQRFIDEGKNVGLVTNDQAYNLVDTQTLRAKGFSVGEVAGACFCCKFDDLVATAESLSADTTPDVIIAEPVGSCTDLMVTVIQPMQQLYGDRFELGQLVVLLKPEHGLRILSGKQNAGFSPKAEYIFRKQLEEADSIVVNKCDKLSEEKRQELRRLMTEKFEAPVVFASAKTGEGFDEVFQLANEPGERTATRMDMDYQIYAEGEAELGWYNCQIQATAKQPFSLDNLVLDLVAEVGRRLFRRGAEVAHLKILGQTLHDTSVANLVSSDDAPELSLASEVETMSAEVLVNARVAVEPEWLEQSVQSACEITGQQELIDLKLSAVQSFRPSAPQPTHGGRTA